MLSLIIVLIDLESRAIGEITVTSSFCGGNNVGVNPHLPLDDPDDTVASPTIQKSTNFRSSKVKTLVFFVNY